MLELDLEAFNATFPRPTRSSSIGNGVQFLNRHLSSIMFRNKDCLEPMLDFLRAHKYKGNVSLHSHCLLVEFHPVAMYFIYFYCSPNAHAFVGLVDWSSYSSLVSHCKFVIIYLYTFRSSFPTKSKNNNKKRGWWRRWWNLKAEQANLVHVMRRHWCWMIGFIAYRDFSLLCLRQRNIFLSSHQMHLILILNICKMLNPYAHVRKFWFPQSCIHKGFEC